MKPKTKRVFGILFFCAAAAFFAYYIFETALFVRLLFSDRDFAGNPIGFMLKNDWTVFYYLLESCMIHSGGMFFCWLCICITKNKENKTVLAPLRRAARILFVVLLVAFVLYLVMAGLMLIEGDAA